MQRRRGTVAVTTRDRCSDDAGPLQRRRGTVAATTRDRCSDDAGPFQRRRGTDLFAGRCLLLCCTSDAGRCLRCARMRRRASHHATQLQALAPSSKHAGRYIGHQPRGDIGPCQAYRVLAGSAHYTCTLASVKCKQGQPGQPSSHPPASLLLCPLRCVPRGASSPS